MKLKRASLFYARVVDLGNQLDRLEKKMTGKLLRLEPEYRNVKSAMTRFAAAIRPLVDQEQEPVAEEPKKPRSLYVSAVMELFRKQGREGITPTQARAAINNRKIEGVTSYILRAVTLLYREGIRVIHEGGGSTSTYRVVDEDEE